MICPHCEYNLLRKERVGERCSRCQRDYAVDPKTNPLGLNDLRVRRITATLTDEGRIQIVPDQLWYALSRKRLRDNEFGQGCMTFVFTVAVFVTVISFVAEAPVLLIASAALLVTGVGVAVAQAAGVGHGIPKIAREHFPTYVLDPWRRVYKALPPGVVDTAASARGVVETTGAAGTTGVLICPDDAVMAFLVADGLPARHGLALAGSPEEARAVPSDGPVLVLHDVDAERELFVRRVRDVLPGRTVVDVAPPLRTLRARPQAVPYRDPNRKPDASTMRLLSERGTFTSAELKWLGKGWRYPLVGLPPARLLTVVDRVAGQVTRRVDADRRRAADLGFLTWPETAGPDPVGGP
ncbi:hypothetical protein OG259_39435 [Streptomyces sp. NBC_00250]|uniref:hypothetical protein n=1 Tax=Streptomyces sp. NBC_00250 TaxID=2903641 RepID=UPI002E2A297D|nr:hypothetical protein [Streptomyces sp. NBC_00250]